MARTDFSRHSQRAVLGVLLLGVAASTASGAIPGRSGSASLSSQLIGIRARVLTIEQNLIDSIRAQREAKGNVKRLQELIGLRREERRLGLQRIEQLEKTVGELETRRGTIREKIGVSQRAVRNSLRALEIARQEMPKGALWEQEHGDLRKRAALEAARRKVLVNLAAKGVRELETLRIDLEDADRLEQKLQEERQQLAYLSQELEEKESVLELNRQLQSDVIRQRHDERIAQLESYRNLKRSESEVERLIDEFNARRELERAMDTEKTVARAMAQAEFARLRGRLPLPVQGKIVAGFGKALDRSSGLKVFRKGIEIGVEKKAEIRSVSAGKIAFSGELPGMGRIVILDHGGHFYTLCGKVGTLLHTQGKSVGAGELLAYADDLGTPVYFEIRARNIPVNPLQWVSK